MTYTIAALATIVALYLFCRWVAYAPALPQRVKAIDPFYHAPGKVGTTSWDRI